MLRIPFSGLTSIWNAPGSKPQLWHSSYPASFCPLSLPPADSVRDFHFLIFSGLVNYKVHISNSFLLLEEILIKMVST